MNQIEQSYKFQLRYYGGDKVQQSAKIVLLFISIFFSIRVSGFTTSILLNVLIVSKCPIFLLVYLHLTIYILVIALLKNKC